MMLGIRAVCLQLFGGSSGAAAHCTSITAKKKKKKDEYVVRARRFGAPTFQPEAFACLHRPNPIAMHPFKLVPGKVCGKSIEIHCGGKGIVWRG